MFLRMVMTKPAATNTAEVTVAIMMVKLSRSAKVTMPSSPLSCTRGARRSFIKYFAPGYFAVCNAPGERGLPPTVFGSAGDILTLFAVWRKFWSFFVLGVEERACCGAVGVV